MSMSHIWPTTAQRSEAGEIEIGGVSLVHIAQTLGTPTYVYDELTLRMNMRAFRDAFASALPGSRVVFAGKAFLAKAIVRMVRDEDLGLDCVSDGEMYAGLVAGMDPARMSLHGNNKSESELRMALESGIGKIIVDSHDEIALLAELTADRAEPMPVMIRVNPGVDVHTHKKISTGVIDSKFGFGIANGQAEEAVRAVMATQGLQLLGYHAHVGSQLFDTEAHVTAVDDIVAFGKAMVDKYDAPFEHLSPGGGFGIAYTEADSPMSPVDWARIIADAVTSACERLGVPMPIVTVEPGRAIVGPAGVAVYTVGSRKEIPGVRTYVSVDGGMADNVRPSLYEAVYTAEIANRNDGEGMERVTIAGKYCESGDLLIEEIELPAPKRNDVLAIPAAGAYCVAMASNYNMSRRPAVVLVADGRVEVIRHRESFDDLLRLDA